MKFKVKKKKLIIVFSSFLISFMWVGKIIVGFLKLYEEKERLLGKYQAFSMIQNTWLTVRQENINIGNKLYDMGYRTIAVYGLGMLGKSFIKEVENSKCKVEYIIDRHPVNSEKLVLSPDKKLRSVDAIIVTAVCDYNEIRQKLLQKTDCPVIALDALIYGV